MIRSAHIDTFARDHCRLANKWPDILFNLPELQYPGRLNCVRAFVDDWVASGNGGRDCLISSGEKLTYAELAERVNRIANVLMRDLGVVSGQARAVARPEQSDDGRGLFRRDQSRRHRGRDHAAAGAKEIAYPLTKAAIGPAFAMPVWPTRWKKRRRSRLVHRIVYWGATG